ncbi:hypothetical protein MTR67_025689 [Solanum verrucosum]|uniref:Uncharacterized protein n=1 Tax=Solanum verrucosum TaxID=315347 RepID=A0AAF0TU40_SOLVR|nr:hypothetical protein MTR67_025689 [Solanum verrucosum]
MEYMKEENGQIVIPVFYNVDPSHVRHQRENFAKAFAKHELKYKDDVERMERKKDNYVNNKEDGKHMIAHRLRFKKVLVVLDDIDHRDHLDYLAGNSNWYGNGSRIVATTRDKHLIETSDVIYEVTTLVDHEAIKLFNQYAFVKKEVPDEYFEKLSMEVVHHARGLPLALKVWGSLLHKRDITEWRVLWRK